LGEAIDFIRNISHELRPSSLDKLGLMPCLETLITDMKRNSGIGIKFFNNRIPEKLDSEKSLALYRIVQESLNNIVKHADAEEVFINLMHRDDTIHLSVEDNGRGFDYQEKTQIIDSDQGPLGLSIMRERAVQVGGTLWVETGKGRGTTVLVEIPLKEDAGDQ
jgi:signal transduction histidine kinase